MWLTESRVCYTTNNTRILYLSTKRHTLTYVDLCVAFVLINTHTACSGEWITRNVYRVIKTYLCTSWLQYRNIRGPGSSVGIATDYGLDGLRIESKNARFFAHVQTGPGAHPASCTMGTGSFSGVKRPERGADNQPSPSVEVENE
jgi:hypothetical protein